MTPNLLFKPFSLTLGLACLAGCTISPALTSTSVGRQSTTSQATTPAATVAKATTTTTTAAAPFASTTKTAAVTPTSIVTSEDDAKAVAANDEQLIESISAALESDELDASLGYSVASVQAASELPEFRTVLNARQAKPPVRQPAWGQAEQVKLEERRAQTIQAKQTFEREHPQYASEAVSMRQAVDRQAWQPNAEDDSTVCRQGSTTQKTASGAQRKVAMTRVIGKAKPHFLVQSSIEVQETGPDGTKTIKWEKTLQAGGSCHVVFHHEYTSRDGRLWVTDWEKVLTVDGTISGTGSFQQCDRQGRRVKEDRLVLGGNDRHGQKVSCIPVASPSPSATVAPTASPSVEVSASPSPEVSESPSPEATPTPEPSVVAVCRTGAVTGGGRLANSNYSFGFGPQVITINDVTENGVELKADVADVIYDGNTATLTGKLRSPAAGTVTLVVTDNGEGANDPDDTVTFLTGATVTASGPISRGEPGGGNVQVRNDCE